MLFARPAGSSAAGGQRGEVDVGERVHGAVAADEDDPAVVRAAHDGRELALVGRDVQRDRAPAARSRRPSRGRDLSALAAGTRVDDQLDLTPDDSEPVSPLTRNRPPRCLGSEKVKKQHIVAWRTVVGKRLNGRLIMDGARLNRIPQRPWVLDLPSITAARRPGASSDLRRATFLALPQRRDSARLFTPG